MIRGSRLSAQALQPRMRAQEIIANNLANLNTTGFRRERLAFHEALNEAAVGTGRQNLVSVTDEQAAELYATGAPLDVGIDGVGFFAVQAPNGDRYTRAGSFQLSPEGVLVTPQGHPVLGDGGAITLPPGDVVIADDGTVRVDDASVGRLRVVSIDAEDLVPDGEGLYQVRGGAEPGEADPLTRVRQGFLERSNVSPVDEMIYMIANFREYETNHQAMQVQGDTLKKLIEQQMR